LTVLDANLQVEHSMIFADLICVKLNQTEKRDVRFNWCSQLSLDICIFVRNVYHGATDSDARVIGFLIKRLTS